MNASSHLSQAATLINLQQWSPAAEALKKYLNSTLSPTQEQRALTMLALCAWMLDDLDATAGVANQMIHSQPQSVYGYFLLALVLHKRNELDAALQIVQDGLHQQPNDPGSLALMCTIQWQQHDHSDARMTATYLRRMHPEHPLVRIATKQTASWVRRATERLRAFLATSQPTPSNSLFLYSDHILSH